MVRVYFLVEDWFLPSLDPGADPSYGEDQIHYFYTWLRFDFELHKAAKKFWDQMVSQEEDQDNYSHLGQVCMDLEDDDEQENIEDQMGLEDDDQLEGPEDGDDVEYQEDDEEYMED
ncbi:hypothetical protein Q3G72_032291 [Acer saccharum]|nr:hypothetical protein Q3G72_032291 [Acer saccharum]